MRPIELEARTRMEGMQKSEYQLKAQDFMGNTGTKLTVTYARTGKHFDDDKQERDIYTVSLNRGNRGFTFEFGQSVVHSGKYQRPQNGNKCARYVEIAHKKPFDFYGDNWHENKDFQAPNAYNILACLTKSDPGTFEQFCADYGYDTDSRKAEKTYNAVVNEWHNVAMLWTDAEIAKLQEIN